MLTYTLYRAVTACSVNWYLNVQSSRWPSANYTNYMARKEPAVELEDCTKLPQREASNPKLDFSSHEVLILVFPRAAILCPLDFCHHTCVRHQSHDT